MEIRLDGRTAVITGGSKVLGLAMATRFAASGADVAILARRPDALEQARAAIAATARGRIETVPCDVAKADDVQRAFDAVNMSGFLSGGRYTKQFEHEVSRWCGLESVAVANCGMGLYAILRTLPKRAAALGRPRGYGVAVVSANTFFA